jgi:hypothetical protein
MAHHVGRVFFQDILVSFQNGFQLAPTVRGSFVIEPSESFHARRVDAEAIRETLQAKTSRFVVTCAKARKEELLIDQPCFLGVLGRFRGGEKTGGLLREV